MSISHKDIREGAIENHLGRINHEFKAGFEFIKKHPRSVSIFGSSVIKPGTQEYLQAEKLAGRIVKELKYAVITGGGPGIMEAANKGAYESNGHSDGLSISLPHEHIGSNHYVSDNLRFSYFFARKTILTFAAEAYIFFPGGYGTFDELFSILTLIQTGKIPRVPVIMFDSKFWKPLKAFLEKTMIDTYGTIENGDLDLFLITDSMDEVIERVRTAPVSEWWRNIN